MQMIDTKEKLHQGDSTKHAMKQVFISSKKIVLLRFSRSPKRGIFMRKSGQSISRMKIPIIGDF